VPRRRLRLENRLAAAAARLDSLSPLAVLGRGYAVCWNDERTRVLRAATDTVPGEAVRVRLQTGELRCDVREIMTAHGTDDH
jgi:exodeoxyribonuclease VII large subunit